MVTAPCQTSVPRRLSMTQHWPIPVRRAIETLRLHIHEKDLHLGLARSRPPTEERCAVPTCQIRPVRNPPASARAASRPSLWRVRRLATLDGQQRSVAVLRCALPLCGTSLGPRPWPRRDWRCARARRRLRPTWKAIRLWPWRTDAGALSCRLARKNSRPVWIQPTTAVMSQWDVPSLYRSV